MRAFGRTAMIAAVLVWVAGMAAAAEVRVLGVNPESRVRLAKDRETTYEGGLMTDGSVPEAARAFVRFLAEPDARAKWVAGKLEPLADH